MTPSRFNLAGKTALVTGSTKGIGRGVALDLAEAGANIVIVSRNQADCDDFAEVIRAKGVKALPFAADVTNSEAVGQLIEKTLETFSRIDILINNAGTAITKAAVDITEKDWDTILNLNLKSVFFVAQAVGKVMIEQKRGKIINIASILGIIGERQVLPYCASKGGVIQMTKALALEWARYDIQVNALCPGYVLTPINEKDMSNVKVLGHILKKIPMRRLGRVNDMAGAAVFLASEESDYMTGQTLVIDGGWTAE